MQVPFEEIKERLYFGRLKKYLNAGKLYASFSESKLEELSRNLSPPSRCYLKHTLSQPNILAYHEVQGQLTLIDADIFYLIQNDYQNQDLQCAFNVGQFFYDIKIVDSFIDNRLDLSIEKRIDLLNSAEEAILGKANYTRDNEFNNIIEILSSSRILGQSHKKILDNIKCNVSRSLKKIPDKNRLFTTEEIGADMGKIMHSLMKESYPEIPDWTENFLIQQGIAANIFDDMKDFSIDRKRNQGYSFQYLPVLFTDFWYHFFKTHKMPLKSLPRFYTFMFLGSVFQLEELFHFKSRT